MDTYDLELCEIFQTARIALDNPSRYERLCWTARQYNRSHPETSIARAYKDAHWATMHPAY